jgi:hypothetical protein
MTRTFQTVGSLGRERVGASAFLLQDGRVLISGGTDEDSDHFSNSAELFLPHENRFIPVAASMGTERQGAAMAQLPDGKVLVAGGINAEGPVRSLEYFDPDSRTFRPGPRSNLRGTQVHVTVLEGHPVLFWSEEPWAEVME